MDIAIAYIFSILVYGVLIYDRHCRGESPTRHSDINHGLSRSTVNNQ